MAGTWTVPSASTVRGAGMGASCAAATATAAAAKIPAEMAKRFIAPRRKRPRPFDWLIQRMKPPRWLCGSPAAGAALLLYEVTQTFANYGRRHTRRASVRTKESDRGDGARRAGDRVGGP